MDFLSNFFEGVEVLDFSRFIRFANNGSFHGERGTHYLYGGRCVKWCEILVEMRYEPIDVTDCNYRKE